MSKELTPLEALEKIDHTICLAFNDNNKALFNKDNKTHIDCKDIDEFCDCYDIIETALNKAERMKELIISEQNTIQYLHDILRIIKERRVNVLELSTCANYETYLTFFNKWNWYGEYDKYILTQEEYNLLKEVLGDENR